MEPTKYDMKYAAVRRAIIEQRFSKLNDKQREVEPTIPDFGTNCPKLEVTD